MRDELNQKLFNDFPDLYRGRNLPINRNLMCFGFSCGSGWYNILYQLSNTLTQLISELPKNEQADYIAVHVKEKFGSLRYAMSKSNEQMREAIRDATREAQVTCQDCGGGGGPKELITGSDWGVMKWIFILCESCSDQRELRRIEAQLREVKEICVEPDE